MPTCRWPTVHRLLGELVAGGAVVKRPDGGYVVGRRLWDVGRLAPVETGLREVAAPFLTTSTRRRAPRCTSPSVRMPRCSTSSGSPGRTSVPVVSQVGTRLPMHSTGVGKVLLAHAPDDVVEEALGRLTRLTPYTVTQPARLRAQLAAVRRDGYATTVEEMTLGACSVAVPIRAGADDAVVAAVGVVVPNLARHRARLVTGLHVAAQGIGRSIA